MQAPWVFAIGLNYLTSREPLWFTLADGIASGLLTGRPPRVLRAITFTPREPQPNLSPIAIAGDTEYSIDPYNDDFYKRLIDLRQTVKASLKVASGSEAEKLDIEQLALKIIANATSYGIFV